MATALSYRDALRSSGIIALPTGATTPAGDLQATGAYDPEADQAAPLGCAEIPLMTSRSNGSALGSGREPPPRIAHPPQACIACLTGVRTYATLIKMKELAITFTPTVLRRRRYTDNQRLCRDFHAKDRLSQDCPAQDCQALTGLPDPQAEEGRLKGPESGRISRAWGSRDERGP